jgi:hypothetical protein
MAGNCPRRHGMSSATYYTWKAKFGGLGGADIEDCKIRKKKFVIPAFAGMTKVYFSAV